MQKLVEINPIVFEKLLFQNQSYTDRLYAPLTDMLLSLQNPFGYGVGGLAQKIDQMSLEIFGESVHTRTSSITYYFAAFGWINGAYILVAVLNFAKRLLKSKIAIIRILNIVGVILLCTSTPLNENMVFMIILFIGVDRVSKLHAKDSDG